MSFCQVTVVSASALAPGACCARAWYASHQTNKRLIRASSLTSESEQHDGRFGIDETVSDPHALATDPSAATRHDRDQSAFKNLGAEEEVDHSLVGQIVVPLFADDVLHFN